MASSFLSFPVLLAPPGLLRDEEDGRADKEPVPSPFRLPFVALSPSLLVTHDYALSTGEQVLLFACNSITISVNLSWARVHSASSGCAFYIWLACKLFDFSTLSVGEEVQGCVHIYITYYNARSFMEIFT